MNIKFEARYDEFGTVFESSTKLRKISTVELQNILDMSTSLSNVIERLGMCVKPNYLNMLRTIIASRHLDLSKMKDNLNSRNGFRKYTKLDILCEKSKYHRKALKEYILSNQLIEYKCVKCGIVDTYNDSPIVLQLDHINGTSDDNRIENLRWLCPNCHSQTDTFAGRNSVRVKKSNNCIECGIQIGSHSAHCRACQYIQHKPKKLHITKEELEVLIKEKPMTVIGKMLGVSDNAIRKRCKLYGIL